MGKLATYHNISLPMTNLQLLRECPRPVHIATGVCPGIWDAFTKDAPECFERCPLLCEVMDTLFMDYMVRGNALANMRFICAQKANLLCLYGTSQCNKLRDLTKDFGINLGKSAFDLDERCAAVKKPV